MHATNQKTQNEAIDIIRKYGSIEYAKSFAQNMVRESWKDVNRILPPSEAKEKLKAFADYLIERKI
jgi:geranylgeranyl pyrophosphate synthase